MKKEKCFIGIFLIISTLTLGLDVIADTNMKIYRYYDWKTPKCADLWRGYYLDKTTREVIGFGGTSTTANDGATEISESEYYKWVKHVGGNGTEAASLLAKLSSLATTDFYGLKVTTAQEVDVMAQEKISALFSDPAGKLSTVEYQIKLISQMVVILLANQGVISYADTGINGVIDKASASEYVLNLLPLWLQASTIKTNAELFIKDNNL